MTARILIIGCGKMGGALLDGWLESGWSCDKICVVESFAPTREAWQAKGLTAVPDLAQVPQTFVPDVVLLGVKPQMVQDVLPGLSALLATRCLDRRPMVISILAGIPVATFVAAFGPETPILRVMPNTPAAVGCGVSGLYASEAMNHDQKMLGERLLQAVGSTVWVETEDLMHAVTALSGSGPAYVFHMVEAMAKAGEHLGLTAEEAMALARQTIIGSAELLRQSPDDASQLRINVTSPGGTTAEALAVMMREGAGLTELMTEAMTANAKRSRELAG